jgi:hypothetical protein
MCRKLDPAIHFNNQTQVLATWPSDLPSEGPAYDFFFYSTMSAQYLLQIWQTILKQTTRSPNSKVCPCVGP